MLPAEQHPGIGFSQVRKEPIMAAVMRGQGLTQAALGRFALTAQRPVHDAPPGSFDHDSKPHFAFAAVDEFPQLIDFERFPAFASGAEAAREGPVLFSRLAIVIRATPIRRTMMR